MREQGWLDQTLAVPVIGILTKPWLGFATGIWMSLEKLGEKWKGDVNIHPNSAISVRVSRSNGIYFDLTHSSINAGFTYQLTVKSRPALFPELVGPSTVEPFNELVDRVATELRDLLEVSGDGGKSRSVIRIGCIADCRLAEDTAPPGLRKLLNHLERPWPGKLKGTEGTLLVELSNSTQTREQCHHTVSRNAYDRPNDLVLRLDWQRMWHDGKPMRTSELITAITSVKTDAASYFQSFGEGTWGDE